MKLFSGPRTAWAIFLLLLFFAAGISLGAQMASRAALAASAPRLVSFANVINGKLDVFAPGVTYKTIATENGSDFMATQITAIRRHRHDHSTEFLYVVSGNGIAILGSTKHPIKPGSMISIPAGTPHGFTAQGAPLRFVEVDTPSIAANDTHYMP